MTETTQRFEHYKGTGIGRTTLLRGGGRGHRPERHGTGVTSHPARLELMPIKLNPEKKGGEK